MAGEKPGINPEDESADERSRDPQIDGVLEDAQDAALNGLVERTVTDDDQQTRAEAEDLRTRLLDGPQNKSSIPE